MNHNYHRDAEILSRTTARAKIQLPTHHDYCNEVLPDKVERADQFFRKHFDLYRKISRFRDYKNDDKIPLIEMIVDEYMQRTNLVNTMIRWFVNVTDFKQGIKRVTSLNDESKYHVQFASDKIKNRVLKGV